MENGSEGCGWKQVSIKLFLIVQGRNHEYVNQTLAVRMETRSDSEIYMWGLELSTFMLNNIHWGRKGTHPEYPSAFGFGDKVKNDAIY